MVVVVVVVVVIVFFILEFSFNFVPKLLRKAVKVKRTQEGIIWTKHGPKKT